MRLYQGIAILFAAALSVAVAARGDVATLGVVDLAGEWRLFLGESSAGSTPELDDSRWRRLTLPASWRQLAAALDVRPADLRGLVWFRRQVTLPADWGESTPSGLSILIAAAPYGSYELYAGGELVGSLAGELPAPRTRVFRIPGSAISDGGRLQLAYAFRRVAWPRDRLADAGGPVGGRMVLGDDETLRAAAETARLVARRERFPAVLVACLLAAIALYHLQLYALRRGSPGYLWFGLLALDFAALTWVGGGLDADEGLKRRAVAVLGHLGIALAVQFLWPILARPAGRWVRAYQWSQVLIALVLAFAPGLSWIAGSQIPRWLWGVPFVVETCRLLGGEA